MGRDGCGSPIGRPIRCRRMPRAPTLVGRVWNPEAGGPSRGRAPRRRAGRHHRRPRRPCATSARRTIRRRWRARPKGRSLGALERHSREHAARRPRCEKALAARADRPAGDQGGGRHLRRLDAGARDRGAGARRGGARERDPRRDHRRRSATISRRLKPGSEQAKALKELLDPQKSMWSQYLEVGIGPDAEVFTKAQPMSAVGHLAEAGLQSDVGVEQSRAGGRAGRVERRKNRRRDARQRRQPARRRGALGAAPRQGQGQQCQRRDRPVHPPLRRGLLARRRAQRRASADASTARTASGSKARAT